MNLKKKLSPGQLILVGVAAFIVVLFLRTLQPSIVIQAIQAALELLGPFLVLLGIGLYLVQKVRGK